MASTNPATGALVAPIILLCVGCICIGYDLAKIVNDLDGAGPLVGVGATCSGLAAILLTRASAASKD